MHDLRFIRRIQLACRNLQRFPVQGIAVLAHHKKLSVIRYCHHCSRSVMMDIIPVSLVTIGDDSVLIDF